MPLELKADLGESEIESKEWVRTFDAFCSEEGNDCKVTFDKNGMRVNEGIGIKKSQVMRIWTDSYLKGFWQRSKGSMYANVFYVNYKKKDGSSGTGKFIFLHTPTAKAFWNELNMFAGKEAVSTISGGNSGGGGNLKRIQNEQKMRQLRENQRMLENRIELDKINRERGY